MKSCASAAPAAAFDLLLRDMRLTVGNVVPHGVVEQNGLLGHDADLFAEGGDGNVANILAVDGQTLPWVTSKKRGRR